MSEPNPPPALHTDDDWKQQAQSEKQRLAAGLGEKSAQPTPAAPAAPPAGAATPRPAERSAERPARRADLPAPSFDLIVQQYVTQAMLALGVIANPGTGKTVRDLPIAQHYIDTLGVLQEKTKGNLSKSEQDLLDAALYEVRMLYVDAARRP